MDTIIVVLRITTIVAYFTGALFAIVIAGFSRNGPNYHPALKLTAMSSGMQGLWIGLISVMRFLPGGTRPPEAATLLGWAAVFVGACALQVGAIRVVTRRNSLWREGDRCPCCYGPIPPDLED